MAGSDRAPPPDDAGEGEPEEVLRRKYYDYCSAEVAGAFLRLTPDEIYVLAQDVMRDSGEGDAADLTYDRIVERVTSAVLDRLLLPPFDVWVEDYRENPGSYERYFLGLWREDRAAAPGEPN